MKNYKDTCQNTLTASGKQNLRENVKELFNTLKEQNGLAWKEIVRNYKQQEREGYGTNKTITK